MRLEEIRDLIRLEPIETDPVARRLARSLNIEDLRRAARRQLPRAVFDYVDGAADEEITLAANRAAFRGWHFHPRTLRNISDPSLETTAFGRVFASPLMLCPTGYTRMMHPAGELAVARAATTRGLPYGLSTVGTTTIEDLAAGGHDDLWFQLYVQRDRGLTRRLVERAAEAGYKALEITVDTAVSGRRERDVRNGLTIPPSLRARTVLDIGLHVGYWTRMVRSPALVFSNLDRPGIDDKPETDREPATAANMANMFDVGFTWDELDGIRQLWKGPLLLKGPISPSDAVRAREMGVDGFHLSNHGGRQLDRNVPSVELIRPLRDVLGDEPAIVVDSGIRHGSDMAVAIARGADLCGIGRAYVYGLAAGGERGVLHVVDLLLAQFTRTLQLLGVGSVAELRKDGDELVRRALPG